VNVSQVSLERLGGMVRKEFRQVFRDPRMVRVIFVAPVIQLLIFGYAVSTDIRHTPMFVVDHDQTQDSRRLTDVLVASGYFQVVGRSERPQDMADALDRSDAIVGLEIPVGLSAALRDGTGAQVQLLLDGTNANTALVAQGYAERIIGNFGAQAGGLRMVAPVDLRERAWYNPDLASRNYNVPAVIGAITMLACLLLTALAVVREREIGTLEQLRVSPLTAAEFIAGKTIPFGMIGLVDLTIVTAVALAWFDIPFRGSVLVLLVASFWYLLTALGFGLFISTISSTQQEAFMASFLFYMPTMLLSGFMFPVSCMPKVIQWLTYLNPMRHYLQVVRGVFLKGAGFGSLWPTVLILAVMGFGVLGLAVGRFRRESE
jgi:ABC-2 type transport system permease protein